MCSKDKRDGIELTWNTWLFIEEFEKGKKHVFIKDLKILMIKK